MSTSPNLDHQHRPLLWLVALAIFMQMLDSTIVSTALAPIAHDLHESPLQMQSVMLSYALAVALLIPASGWIADRLGTRLTFFIALVTFTVGSGLCAAANRLIELNGARIIQGIGGAMLVPIGRLAILKTVRGSALLRAFSFMTIPALVGPLIGPALGGWLTEMASWHWIFLINLPIGLFGALATLRIMPDYREPIPRQFDIIGYILIALAMTSLCLAINGPVDLNLNLISALLLAIAAVAATIAYYFHAAVVDSPIFPVSLFALTSYRIGILGNLIARIGSSAMPLLLPILLQVGLEFSPTDAGLMLMPAALSGMLTKRLAVSFVRRFGYRLVLIANTLILGLTIASFFFTPHLTTGQQLLQLACFGGANGLQFTIMNTITLRDLSSEQTSPGNTVLSMTMMLSAGLGPALAGTLLFAWTKYFATGQHPLVAIQATFCCISLVTIFASIIFWQLTETTLPSAKTT